MFTTYMFGHAPQAPAKLDYEVKEVKKNALQGCVTRKQVTIYLTPEREQGIHINLQIYLPNSTEASKPVPIFLGISFLPNYTVYDDPDLHLPDNYIKPDYDDDFARGIIPYYYRRGQTYPDPDQWGAIAA